MAMDSAVRQRTFVPSPQITTSPTQGHGTPQPVNNRLCEAAGSAEPIRSIGERTLQRQAAAVISKRGGAEVRWPETAGGVVGKAVALGRLAEQAWRQLGFILLGMKERDRVVSGRNAGEHTGRLAGA